MAVPLTRQLRQTRQLRTMLFAFPPNVGGCLVRSGPL